MAYLKEGLFHTKKNRLHNFSPEIFNQYLLISFIWILITRLVMISRLVNLIDDSQKSVLQTHLCRRTKLITESAWKKISVKQEFFKNSRITNPNFEFLIILKNVIFWYRPIMWFFEKLDFYGFLCWTPSISWNYKKYPINLIKKVIFGIHFCEYFFCHWCSFLDTALINLKSIIRLNKIYQKNFPETVLPLLRGSTG